MFKKFLATVIRPIVEPAVRDILAQVLEASAKAAQAALMARLQHEFPDLAPPKEDGEAPAGESEATPGA